MGMQKSISIKALSILLSILLVVTLCPLSALANESSDEIEKTVETQEHAQDQIEPTQGSGLEDNNAKIESTTEVDGEKKIFEYLCR